MTGFVQLGGTHGSCAWQWDLRSVNSRGLDLRIRLPEGFESLEPDIRTEAPKWLRRGAVSLTLKLSKTEETGLPEVDAEGLRKVVAAVKLIEEVAAESGLRLAPVSAADVLSLPDEQERPGDETGEIAGHLRSQVARLFEELATVRAAEGRALRDILQGQIAALEKSASDAARSAEARTARTGELMRQKVRDLLDATDIVDEARLAQELAIIAVKSDVTEEIDRLNAHIAAARELLKAGGAVGRKFDFLMQELNREANTLCSKSGSAKLTAIGLEMKVLIDQMREQVQNLE
ncbi:MAG: YicC/YloC family endoribonuclease [Paracoccaceae bacterium]